MDLQINKELRIKDYDKNQYAVEELVGSRWRVLAYMPTLNGLVASVRKNLGSHAAKKARGVSDQWFIDNEVERAIRCLPDKDGK